MITVYPYKKLGGMNWSWLKAKYHFSFYKYYDPKRLGFGKLKVINDDIVKAGAGFETHPHRDMEIITYVRKGAITHKDSEGNKGRTVAGDVQVMSAGTGIFHSEYNLESEDTVLYQIWIEPHTKHVDPSWTKSKFPKAYCKESLPLLVSGRPQDKDSSALFIHQRATIYGGNIAKGTTIEHIIDNQAYILVSKGEVKIDGKPMHVGDGAEVTDCRSITITAQKNSEILVIDVPR
jgi:redox-sensitive bicupin YhaK (pirin superfamily)